MKAGQKVEVTTGEEGLHSYHVGEVVEILNVQYDDERFWYTCTNSAGTEQVLWEEDFKILED